MADEEGEGKQDNVLARVIIEMLGAPKEHIEKTLKDYVEKLKQDKEMKILKEELAPAKEQKKLFSTFAELEILFSNSQKLVDFCFDAMPSSVEIIRPEKIIVDSSSFTDTLNDMQAKLHNNDMIIKTLRAKSALLDKNAKAVLRNFIYFLIKDEPRPIEYLSEEMGIGAKQLRPFLDELIKAGNIAEKEGKYERIE